VTGDAGGAEHYCGGLADGASRGQQFERDFMTVPSAASTRTRTSAISMVS